MKWDIRSSLKWVDSPHKQTGSKNWSTSSALPILKITQVPCNDPGSLLGLKLTFKYPHISTDKSNQFLLMVSNIDHKKENKMTAIFCCCFNIKTLLCQQQCSSNIENRLWFQIAILPICCLQIIIFAYLLTTDCHLAHWVYGHIIVTYQFTNS